MKTFIPDLQSGKLRHGLMTQTCGNQQHKWRNKVYILVPLLAPCPLHHHDRGKTI